MSIRANFLANYFSQLYAAVVAILILPLYIKYLGAEAYGLVGFFAMLQSWFVMLDLGLTPTISRETARYFGGGISALAYRQLYRALSMIFAAIAIIGGGVLFGLSETIAYNWLNVDTLSMTDVVLAVQIIAISVALRWMTGLYRGVVTGAEHLVWLSAFNVLIVTLRFIAVFLTMYIFGYTPTVFFLHQFAVAVLEQLGLWWKAQKVLPGKKQFTGAIGWSFQPVKPVLKFSLTIAFTSAVLVLATQSDKLVISGILSLSEYGYFTVGAFASGGIMILSGPISNVIMPRMSRLHAEGKHAEMIQVYRNATQLASILAGVSGVCIAFFAEELLYVWTGDRTIATEAAPILSLYALGNVMFVVSEFPYYLQYAMGKLRYHLIGNGVLAAVLIPASILAATRYGGVGAGWTWFLINSAYFVIWVTYIHTKIEPGLHWKWLLNDIVKIFLPAMVILIPFLYWPLSTENRWTLFATLAAVGLLILIASALGSKNLRTTLKHKFS